MRLRFVVAVMLTAFLISSGPAGAQERPLRVAVPAGDAGNLDPHRSSASQDVALFGWMFNGLVRFPPGSADPARLEADLAERWESSPDGLVWTFHLRRGVKFHHGYGELTADDVVFSLRRAADTRRSSFASDFTDFRTVDAVDPYTVRITLANTVPSLLGLVSDYHGGLIISRRAAEEMGDDFRRRPIGTGPFAFGEYRPQTVTTLVAHREYFRGAPRVPRIEVRYITSDATRELAFTSGEIDLFAGRREQRWVERMRSQRGVVVDVFRPGEFRTLLINTRMRPLDDVRVRRAIAHAIDVNAIVRFVGADVVVPGRSVVPQGYLGETPEVPRYAPDLARARALLAEAGHPNGFTIRAVVSNISAQLPIMEQVQAQLRRVGINLEMEVVDHSTYHAKIRQDLSALTFYGAARFPIADSYLTQFYHSRSRIGTPTAALNFAHCDVADAEIDAARAEPNRERQLALWADAQRRIMTQVCSVPLYDLLQVWVRRDALDLGYQLDGSLNLAPPITEATSIR
ncbi:MAG: polyamine ABC transporter substrate-binding protein [Alphaproteobacteria bacterium]|nr:polyamine ABC transporter substrate-binding protein [Alphaproteobacteria bacterium]